MLTSFRWGQSKRTIRFLSLYLSERTSHNTFHIQRESTLNAQKKTSRRNVISIHLFREQLKIPARTQYEMLVLTQQSITDRTEPLRRVASLTFRWLHIWFVCFRNNMPISANHDRCVRACECDSSPGSSAPAVNCSWRAHATNTIELRTISLLLCDRSRTGGNNLIARNDIGNKFLHTWALCAAAIQQFVSQIKSKASRKSERLWCVAR